MRTFVVRVWAGDSGSDGPLRGVVEPVGGEPSIFRSEHELVSYLASRAQATAPEGSSAEDPSGAPLHRPSATS